MNAVLFSFIIGIFGGILLVSFFWWLKKRLSRDLELKKEKEFEDLMERLRGTFAVLSSEALSKNSEAFLQLAKQKFEASVVVGEKDLENKKKLIDQTFGDMKLELGKVQDLMRQLEKDRENKFSEISTTLKSSVETTSKLQQTAEQLKSVLANTKSRGQLGEKITEDILHLAGFIENINYVRQKAQGIGRPDYTFLLPQNIRVNMDVKFPLDNYKRFMESESELEKENYKKQFLWDAKQRIKEVTTREYIDPEHKTVDFVIVFVPLEQAYAFINEHDRTILDEALKKKVIFCSPLTLYAILAVIRQAVEIFNLSRTTDTILLLLSSFNKQWQAFIDSFVEMGRKLEAARKEYEALTTTRRNQLDKQLKKIEELRQERGISLEEEDKNRLLDFEEQGGSHE